MITPLNLHTKSKKYKNFDILLSTDSKTILRKQKNLIIIIIILGPNLYLGIKV